MRIQIILMRHGKPDIPKQFIRAREFKEWIQGYNTANLCTASAPTEAALTLSTKVNAIICSSLSRSINSVKRLGLQPTYTDSLFNEMEMPYWSPISPPLPATTWAFLFRICWFAGLTSNAESFDAAKKRAKTAADQLITFAQEHQAILFVGHGILNRFIATFLLQGGWSGPKTPGDNYWEYGVYTYETI